MPDTDLDALLEGESTSKESQPSQENSGEKPTAANPAQEEFNKLSGSAQDRFQKMLRRAKAAEEENERIKALAFQGTKLPPPPPQQSNQDMLTQLENGGVMTQRQFQQMMADQRQRDAVEFKIQRLSELENGEDGRPKFDRYEYEDFVKQNPQYKYYDPVDTYSIMFRDELVDWELRHRSQPQQTSSLKNTKTFTGSDMWTPEYINDMMDAKKHSQEEINAFYDKNAEKIEKVLSQSVPTE